MYLDYHIQEGFLFKNQELYIPQGSMRLDLIKELHSGGLDGDFGMDKTTMLVKKRYFWPRINKDVMKCFEYCRICQLAKGRNQNMGLYTPFSVPENPWEDVSINFVLGLSRTQRKHHSVMVVVDQFSKMSHFLACKKISDVIEVFVLFLKEIVRLHSLLRSITSHRDIRFLGHFWRPLWKKMGSKFMYNSSYHPQIGGKTEVENRILGNLLRSLSGENAS